MADARKLETFLRQVLTALNQAQIAHMLTGSLASSMYGVPRATNDVDLVIAPLREELFILARLLHEANLDFPTERIDPALEHQTSLNVIDFSNGWKADLILRKDREFSIAEFSRRGDANVEGIQLHVVTPEDLVVAKLEWWGISPSERQMEDIVGILQVQGDDLDFRYIEHWVAALGLTYQWHEALRRAP